MHQVCIALGTLLSVLVESAVSLYGTCSTMKKLPYLRKEDGRTLALEMNCLVTFSFSRHMTLIQPLIKI